MPGAPFSELMANVGEHSEERGHELAVQHDLVGHDTHDDGEANRTNHAPIVQRFI